MNLWKQLGDKFKALSEEEDLLARERISGERCYAYIARGGQSGESSWAEGFATEGLQARFESVATEAGIALGCPPGTSPQTYWLNRLLLELNATDSNFSHMYDGANGVIERLFEASNIFCLRLDRRELEKTLIPEDGADSSATDASFAAENPAKGAPGQVAPNLIFEITRDGDRLFAQGFTQLPHNRPGDLSGLPKFELFAEGEKNFFSRVADHQFNFETDPEGRATTLILHRAGRDMAGARLS